VDELVAEVRMVVRIQEVAQVLFADFPLALSDEYWPETRRGLDVYVVPITTSMLTQAQVGLTKGQKELRRLMRAQGATVSAPPPRVVQDTPKPPERLSITSAVQRELDAKARGYTGIPCGKCQSIETIRIGTCLRCDSCGDSGECG